jgi:hypothetical protein
MHALSLLKRWLDRNCDFVHAARREAVCKGVFGLFSGGVATLTGIGRASHPKGREKHGIKSADRLLGNVLLHRQLEALYRVLAHFLLSQTPRPLIVVDWSDVAQGHRHVMIKATVPVGGRSLTLYDQVYPLKQHNSAKANKAFLKTLSQLVPPGCVPIIVTDAGFRGPWFKAVEALGWDWIGRIRRGSKVRLGDSETWAFTETLYSQARQEPKRLGEGWLSIQQPYACVLHLYKASQRGPGRPCKPYKSTLTHKRSRLASREPWLLATSLGLASWSAKRVVKVYRLRMQIEETFRDLKSTRWGYALDYTRSRSALRLENLLWLTTLATLATWLVGMAAEAADLMRHYQANTERKRRVLSTFFLGRRVLTKGRRMVSRRALRDAMQALPFIIHEHAQCA